MSATFLSGTELAKERRAALKKAAKSFQAQHQVTPTLAILRVGDDDAAAGYARAIARNCKNSNIGFHRTELPTDADQHQVSLALQQLNDDPAIHGIMILEPLPQQIDTTALLQQLKPTKDVDGVHPLNAGRLMTQHPPYFTPATPTAGLALLEEAGVAFKGKHAVIVGRSDIVGKPMALLLLHRHCTVTIAHSRTEDLPAVCRSADILCVAVGRAEMVQGDWIKPGAVVVDFGTTYTDDGLKGDCEQETVAVVASLMTPVPGGVGPMTNVMLMQNVLQAATLAVGE